MTWCNSKRRYARMAFCTTARPQLTPRIVLQAIQLQLENQSLHSQVVVLTQTLAQLKGDYHRAVNEGNQLRSEASESRQAVASGQAGGDPTWQARYEDLEAKYRTTRHDLLDAQADLRRLASEYDELAEAAEQDASKVAAGARASEELAQLQAAFSELEAKCHSVEEERDVAKSEVVAVRILWLHHMPRCTLHVHAC